MLTEVLLQTLNELAAAFAAGAVVGVFVWLAAKVAREG